MLVVENCYLPYKFSKSWVIWVDMNAPWLDPSSWHLLYNLTILVKNIFFNRNSCRIIWTNIIECYDSSVSHGLSVSLTLCIYALEHSFLSMLNSTHKFVSFGIRANWT